MTIVPYEGNPSAYHLVGNAAHITAASESGPRYDHLMSSADRKSIENGIWLCTQCADLIDKEQGISYSVELIRSWKQKAEKEVENAALLSAALQNPKWLGSIRTPHYINVTRVLTLNCSVDLSEATSHEIAAGFPKEGYILPELVEVTQILRGLSIKSIDVRQLLLPKVQVKGGLTASFYQSCRTKNGAETDVGAIRNYSFDHSPLIY